MSRENDRLRLGLPKGRMEQGVRRLLDEAGLALSGGSRDYRPALPGGFAVKLLKARNVVEMLHAGSRDVGFTGADLVADQEADLVELLDTELDPVSVVVAAPEEVLEDGRLPQREIVVASEYERLTRRWFEARGAPYHLVRSFGATEVFPPEDADAIVDNTSTGATLVTNRLRVVAEVMTSSTRLWASPRALDDPARRKRIEDLVMLLNGVLDARRRVLLEANVAPEHLEAVVACLPCMREPTIATLHGDAGYAVKAAVPRDSIVGLVPGLKDRGATDIVITRPGQIVP